MARKIPFNNFKKKYQNQKRQIDQAMLRVLQRGIFILGQEVRSFEKEFASYLGVKYAIGVASGTDAITLSLKALGVGQNDEVIIPANSYPTAFAVAASGASIRLVDVDSLSLTIDPLEIERAITKNTRAIIPVHLYGRAANLLPVMKIAKKHKLFVLEDAAQAHGAQYNGKRVGTIGHIGCFSFYPTKNLGALGDGGMIVTNSKQLAETLRQLRMYGEKSRYQSERLGVNSRLDELHACVLRVKLKKLDEQNQLRFKIAELYRKNLQGLDILLPQSDRENHVYHLFVIRTKKRDQLMHSLKKNGVETGIHFPLPIHLVGSFENLPYKKGDFPNSERTAEEILSLPCYPELTYNEVIGVCNLIKKFLK